MSDRDPLLAGTRLLVLDDEPMLAYDLADLLRSHGADICGPCFSLDEAEHVVANDNEPVHCAVLDIQIGKDYVWPIADRLAERDTPFLFISAYCGMNDLPERFRDRHCLTKPVDQAKLQQALAELIRG